MAGTNPLENSYPAASPSVSVKTVHIAGILTDVYGLEELPESCKSISCLWLLHPRLSKKEAMANVASTNILSWTKRRKSSDPGLIAVAFDQRNHGSRLVDKAANEAWRTGNENHAQDMFRYPARSSPFSFSLLTLTAYIMGPLSIPAY
jgi:hypothetical protein